MKIERAQQGGGRLAAGGRGAAVGDGGVRSLERSGVFKRRHGDGRSGPRLCRQRQTQRAVRSQGDKKTRMYEHSCGC